MTGNQPHSNSPNYTSTSATAITNVVTATGREFGPSYFASRWGAFPCPLLPREYLGQYGGLVLPFELVSGLTLSVNELGPRFWTHIQRKELPSAALYRLRDWISQFEFPENLLGIPGGLPRTWLVSLPLSPTTLTYVRQITPKRDLSDVTPHNLRTDYGFTKSAVIELLCVMETAETTNFERSALTDDVTYGGPTLHTRPATNTPVDLIRHIWNPIQLFATWAAQETSAMTLGEAIEATRSRDNPLLEWEALASFPIRGLTDTSVQHSASVLDDWIEQLDLRDNTIFLGRIAPASSQRRTLEAIGQDLGYTRERIRQLEHILRERLRDFIRSGPGSPVRWRIDSIRHHLGVASPMETKNDHAVAGGAWVEHQHLLLELAGPYVEHYGWLVRKSAVASDPTQRIIEATDDYGRINVELASELLLEWGLEEDSHELFLANNRRVRRFCGQLVRWDGPITNKLALVLDMLGKPATVEDLLSAVGQNRSVRATKNVVSSDPRFVRTSLTEWGLADWGLEEYGGIVSVMARIISASDRPIRMEELVEPVSRKFKVSHSSVRSYCGAAQFVIDNGFIRVRRENEPFEYPEIDLSKAKGVFSLADRRISLLYEVDGDVLRGSGRAIGMAAGSLLNIDVNDRLLLRGPENTSAVITFPGSSFHGPSLGSTRGLAELVGAVEGHMLTVIVDGLDETVDVRATELPADSGWPLVARLTGIDEQHGVKALARALKCGTGEVRATLRRRGDLVVLDAMPRRHSSPDLDDALAKLEAEVDRSAIG